MEIWQVDSRGVYAHSQTAKRGNRDKNFQGFGRFLTGSSGEYYFRTVKPPYGGRAGHIHFAVIHNNQRVLTTQLYVKGDPTLKRDSPIRAIRDPKLRNLLIRDFAPVKGSKTGELMVNFDIVVGATPEDPKQDRIASTIPSTRRASTFSPTPKIQLRIGACC